jgi:hypothetical protein
MFFFEKKNQKTFAPLHPLPASSHQFPKVFWLRMCDDVVTATKGDPTNFPGSHKTG